MSSHKQYVNSLATHLNRWILRKSRPLCPDWAKAAVILMHLNLDAAEAILTPLYCCKPRGKKPYNPVIMLRALILMLLLKVESIPQWARQIKTFARLARIAGFDEASDIPVASTFYLFIDRLQNGAYQPPCRHRTLPADGRRGKHLRRLRDEKQQREELRQRAKEEFDSVTGKLAAELIAKTSQRRVADLQKRLEDLLIQCGVLPSAKRGLLGDMTKLSLAGDGSALVSSANGNGKPSCECRAEGKRGCECPRYYSDPTADWGYDSYRECYYFGHTFYQHVISTQSHDLPVHVTIGSASETDFTLSLKSLSRLTKALAENGVAANISHAIYDAGHDANGVYDYLANKQISPIIALNPRNVSETETGGVVVNERGIPICKAGLEMRRHSFAKKKRRIAFNCPVKRPTHKNGKTVWKSYVDKCPLGVLCQHETKSGPVVTVSVAKNPRLYPPIDRASVRFKRLMALRSGCERSNAQKKQTYKLGRRVCRNATHYLVRLYLVSLIEHATVWAKQGITALDESQKAFCAWLNNFRCTLCSTP